MPKIPHNDALRQIRDRTSQFNTDVLHRAIDELTILSTLANASITDGPCAVDRGAKKSTRRKKPVRLEAVLARSITHPAASH